jgi:cation diffusion facilitator family transporter
MTLQKKATLISSFTAGILVLMKLSIGIMSGSVAVMASAIDSVLDLIVSAFNYFAISKAEQPADKMFNYGKGKIEALAAVIEGTIITISGIYIFYQAVIKAYDKSEASHLDISIIVMTISLVVTIALVMFLTKVAKKTKNMVIKSDALHYKTDVLSNGAILISLIIIQITKIEIIDSIMGIIISIYIIYSAYEIIKEGVFILLDAALDEEIVENIKSTIINEEKISNYHYLKTRKSGHTNFVDVHLVFNDGISLLEAHRIGDKVEDKILALQPDVKWVINAHLDPYDDSEINELENRY